MLQHQVVKAGTNQIAVPVGSAYNRLEEVVKTMQRAEAAAARGKAAIALSVDCLSRGSEGSSLIYLRAKLCAPG